MDMINLQLPDSLHVQARKLAAKENISLDQLITLAVAEKVSALLAEEHLGQRAKRGTKKKWLFRLERDYCHVLPLDCQIQRSTAMDLSIHRERIPLDPEEPKKFKRALAKVADVEPDEEDKL